jgi:hypothetical protein
LRTLLDLNATIDLFWQGASRAIDAAMSREVPFTAYNLFSIKYKKYLTDGGSV